VIAHLLRRRWLLATSVLVVGLAVVAIAVSASADHEDALVIYNGRAHYGDEKVFADFAEKEGIEIVLRGGTAPELYERLRREGDDTPADVLVTTDLANLWRAEHSGLLKRVSSPALEHNVAPQLHDPGSEWWAVTTRLRVPVVSTERVRPGEVTSYEDLGDPRYKGRLCLRTSNNEYNQSLVADMIAKRGRPATERMLRSWMANDPEILNSDGELLAVIAAGECDVGLSNHYYLARALMENEDFPVAPAWPDQDGAGAHANVSGAGVVRWSDHTKEAIALIEFLTSRAGQEEVVARGEFAANPEVQPIPQIADWGTVKTDPIDVEHAGPLLTDAIQLMADVGWN
jgi:iron(III) transport system substrate-binding protein